MAHSNEICSSGDGNLLIRHARVVLPDRVLLEADVRLMGGIIVAILEEAFTPLPGETVIDARGRWLLPGLVDLHCDAIEKEVQPRTGVMLPYQMALTELDRKLALVGVTTMFHAVSFGVTFGPSGEGTRSDEVAAGLVHAVDDFATGLTLVRHRVHLRFEITNWQVAGLVRQLIREGCVGLLSFMDHTPGQGQYLDPERFIAYLRRAYGVGAEEAARISRDRYEGRERLSDSQLRDLARLARNHGSEVAAHDLDSPGAVDWAAALGVTIVEFPVTLDAAQHATRAGLKVVVGAPNVLRARSSGGNLSGRESIKAGAADLLCSDYYPSSLLQAVFALDRTGIAPLPEALAMATYRAADAVGIGRQAGAIEVGGRGDLIIVSDHGGRLVVEATIVAGHIVLTAHAHESRDYGVPASRGVGSVGGGGMPAGPAFAQQTR